ncbi:antitoxin [Streptomyces sparsogenes]|uniref:antitoxin n=1 Tax=Streptomyces sparsogenes TaxID=67365 RepID=UPI0033E31971
MGIKDKLKEALGKRQSRARHAAPKGGKGATDQPRREAEKLDEELRRRGEPPTGQQ